jgi:hypothetical protein
MNGMENFKLTFTAFIRLHYTSPGFGIFVNVALLQSQLLNGNVRLQTIKFED